jgi:hypothetical protein
VLQGLRATVLTGDRSGKWTIANDLVLVAGQVYIPSASPLLQVTLASAHGMGHEGIEKSLHRLRSDFFVPGACAVVCNYVRACPTCQ